jgi:aconitate hydratase
MYLAVDGVLARSFGRIHAANLYNFGLLTLEIDKATYERIEQGDDIPIMEDVADGVADGREQFTLRVNDNWEATVQLGGSDREREYRYAGGKLPANKLSEGSTGSAVGD